MSNDLTAITTATNNRRDSIQTAINRYPKQIRLRLTRCRCIVCSLLQKCNQHSMVEASQNSLQTLDDTIIKIGLLSRQGDWFYIVTTFYFEE